MMIFINTNLFNMVTEMYYSSFKSYDHEEKYLQLNINQTNKYLVVVWRSLKRFYMDYILIVKTSL